MVHGTWWKIQDEGKVWHWASKQAMVHGTWWWVQHLFKMVEGKKGMDSVVNCDINYRKSVDCEEIAL